MNPSTSDSRKFLSVGLRLGGLFDSALGLGLLVTWIGCFGRWHWFLALFDHFRIQGAVACLVALCVLLLRRKKWLAGFAAVSLAVNLWPLWQTSFPLPASVPKDESPGLKLVSFNVLTSNLRHAETLAYLEEANADVILLMEVNAVWIQALEPLRQTHPHGIKESAEDNFGIALYSRIHLTDSKIDALVADGMPCALATLQSGSHRLRIIGVHPLPPSNAHHLERLTAQMRAIAKLVASEPTVPAVVLGDFNATPWSPGITLLREESTLDFRTPKSVWFPTWQARGLLALPLDQALCTPPLYFQEREIGPDLGSDHRAQVLSLKWGS